MFDRCDDALSERPLSLFLPLSSSSHPLFWAVTLLLSAFYFTWVKKEDEEEDEGGGHLGFFCSWDYLFLYLLYFFCFPDDFCVLLSVSTVTTRCFYGNGKLCSNIYHWTDPLPPPHPTPPDMGIRYSRMYSTMLVYQLMLMWQAPPYKATAVM